MTFISYPKNLDHLALKAKLSSVPAAPAPHTTTVGTIPLLLSSYSFFSIFGSKSLIGLVVKLCSHTPLQVFVSLVFEPTFKARTS